MMTQRLIRLYPTPAEDAALRGLYLGLELHRRTGTGGNPFVYANFLASLDGRIAIEDASGEPRLPKRLTTANDFRLFLELHCQADCLITHGGYLRALAAGRLGNILQVGAHAAGGDLADWRAQQGLPPQPAVVVASASLDFPIPDSLGGQGQTCYIATGKQADSTKIAYWQKKGFEIILAGEGAMVDGGILARKLGEMGYRTLYLIAGPKMLDTMVRNGVLGRLFQTITHQLLGGEAFQTLMPGPELGARGRMRLVSLYYDSHSPEGSGQWFGQFEPGAEPPDV